MTTTEAKRMIELRNEWRKKGVIAVEADAVHLTPLAFKKLVGETQDILPLTAGNYNQYSVTIDDVTFFCMVMRDAPVPWAVASHYILES